jgi:hypothetical protein
VRTLVRERENLNDREMEVKKGRKELASAKDDYRTPAVTHLQDHTKGWPGS